MEDISLSIKKLMVVFLLLFMALMSYMTYFEFFKAPEIVDSSYNKRLVVRRNEVLRGTIMDRNSVPLSKSDKVSDTTQKRQYTGGEALVHSLGYMSDKYGVTGLEKKYDTELSADDSLDLSVSIMDMIKGKDVNSKDKQKYGHNLKTTIDSNLQKKAYDLLGNNKGAVVVLNPKTGEVLALVSKPSFDPNNLDDIMGKLADYDKKKANKTLDKNKDSDLMKLALSSPLTNRATSGLYPPGSTFKTVTAASMFENMKDAKTLTYNDTGKIVFNDKYSLNNDSGEVLGTVNLKSAYVNSVNTFFGQMAINLGNDKLKATAEKFFFNKDIPADGVYIAKSVFPEIKSYEKGSIAQSGIGQAGVVATPMQMVLVASTVANEGIMMKPYLVSEVLKNDGSSVTKTSPMENGRIITADAAKNIKDYMLGVVQEGTGTRAAISGVKVCGKTGTATTKDSDGNDAEPHSWFIGFAPYDNPQVAVAVIVENGGYGGVAAAGISSEVMKMVLKK